jgi:hypothetical protein
MKLKSNIILIQSHPYQNGYHQENKQTTNAGKGGGWNSHILLVGIQISIANMEVPHKSKNKATISSSYTTFEDMPKEMQVSIQ